MKNSEKIFPTSLPVDCTTNVQIIYKYSEMYNALKHRYSVFRKILQTEELEPS